MLLSVQLVLRKLSPTVWSSTGDTAWGMSRRKEAPFIEHLLGVECFSLLFYSTWKTTYEVETIFVPFTDVGREAQRGKGSCPRTHSKEVA